jgi:DNA-binding Lrp family transcriptional regulator
VKNAEEQRIQFNQNMEALNLQEQELRERIRLLEEQERNLNVKWEQVKRES